MPVGSFVPSRIHYDYPEWTAPVSGNIGQAWVYTGSGYAPASVQPLNANLTAIAGLTSAADRVPYFTGSGTAALATFTAFGRSLVDDADASAARTTLGLGTIATATETSYLLADGSRTGATSSRQVFTSGITTGSIRPASNSTTAGQWQDASGTAVLTVDTTNAGVGLGTTPDPDAVLHVAGTKTTTSGGYAMKFASAITSNGTGSLGGMAITPALAVGASGTATRIAALDFVWTVANSGTVTDTAAILLRPPTWTGTAPSGIAATAWITDAPSVGESKYALYIAAGNLYTNGKIGVGVNPTTALDMLGTASVRANLKATSTLGVTDVYLTNNSNLYLLQQLFGSAYGGTYAGINLANMMRIISTANNFVLGTNANSPLVFVIGGSEVARFTTSLYLAVGQNSATALLDLAASTTARASLRIRAGTAPTSPNDGDIIHGAAGFAFYNVDSGTSDTINHVIANRQSSGTPATGFGSAFAVQLESSAANDRDAGRLSWEWVTATDASRASRGKLTAYSTTTEQTAVTWDGDSDGVRLGFYGVTPIARQLLATGTGVTVDQVITALQSLGLLRQS